MSCDCYDKKGSKGLTCCSQTTVDIADPSVCRTTGSHEKGYCGTFIAETGATIHEKPGYRVLEYVSEFLSTKNGYVPVVRTRLNLRDQVGAVRVRLGIGRDSYRVAPGIYGVGNPDNLSPVMVSANFKLSFDVLRKHLTGLDSWILVVDTRNINVWCAAGKGTFSTAEVVGRVKETRLETIVSHRTLVLPQLAATGVSARHVKKQCGFEVVWGPVHAKNIKAFVKNGMKCTPVMRQVTFTLTERMELIPVELTNMRKPTLYLLPVLFLLSGFGRDLFSLRDAVYRGGVALCAYLLALIAGVVLTPALLPLLFGHAFAVKGAVVGAVTGSVFSVSMFGRLALMEMFALTLFIVAISSYLSMNFTGSTPYTSPTGVEKEMRKAIPMQVATMVVAAILWVWAGFMAG